MNCLILVLLLLSCGNGNGERRNTNNGGNCQNDRSSYRDQGDRDCGCRNDSRSESRLEPRPFISYPGSSCGCEEQRNNNGCDCAD